MSGPDREALARWIAEEHIPEIALHEAGHAVVNVLTGAGVSAVFLRPADEEPMLFMGQVTSADPLATGEHQKAMVSVAGLLAESIRRGESLEDFVGSLNERLDPDGDEDISGLCDERALDMAKGRGVDLEAAVRDARAELVSRWPAVEAVAAALVAKWTPGSGCTVLTGDEVREAMAGATGAEERER